MILGIDLGTTAVKAVLWSAGGPAGVGQAPLTTVRPGPDRVEQDAASWWPAVVTATRAALTDTGRGAPGAIEGIGLSSARQTIVAVDDHLDPVGPALVWSDRRAGPQARGLLAAIGGPEGSAALTGGVLDAASVAAKLAWLREEGPGRLARARWILGPRELVLARLSGVVMSDLTMASRSGLYDRVGVLIDALAAKSADLLPPVVAPTEVAGVLSASAAAELGIGSGIPVVVGAGDRACEVVGTGATPDRPMVSWGTTANVSLPLTSWPDPPPPGLVVSRSAAGGYLLEGGLSGAGSALAWLAELSSTTVADLSAAAAEVAPGADGVMALPWLDGARAPWWRPDAGAGFLGIGSTQGPGHLARALFEGVAWDVVRCLEAARSAPGAVPSAGLVATGGGSAEGPWTTILSAAAGLPVTRRTSGHAASAGAALLAARGLGLDYDVDAFNPVVGNDHPDRQDVAAYAGLRPAADRAARAVLALSDR
jgi:xylulokinase